MVCERRGNRRRIVDNGFLGDRIPKARARTGPQALLLHSHFVCAAWRVEMDINA